MSVRDTLRKYWPWWAALLWLGGYELYAAFSEHALTLSRMAWQAEVAWPPIAFVSTGAALILLFHFWRKNRLKGE